MSILENTEKLKTTNTNNNQSVSLIIRIISLIFLVISIFLMLSLGKQHGKVSAKYQLYVTPASMFFMIWGVIYTLKILINILNLYHNQWSIHVYKYIAIINSLQIIWTLVFNIKTDFAVFSSSLILSIIPYAGYKLWKQMGRRVNYRSKFIKVSRNVYAFFLGWIIAAFNLIFGVLLVYLLQFSKQLQVLIFTLMTPLFAIFMTYLAYKNEGTYGLKCCLSLWISALWGYTGALINSYRCLNGLQAKC